MVIQKCIQHLMRSKCLCYVKIIMLICRCLFAVPIGRLTKVCSSASSMFVVDGKLFSNFVRHANLSLFVDCTPRSTYQRMLFCILHVREWW
jgi:hypothetical protein